MERNDLTTRETFADVNYKCIGLYVYAHLHTLVTRDGQMASSAPPFSAGTESEPILRARDHSLSLSCTGV